MHTHKINDREIESLEQLRGELAVQAALFKADVKKEWEKLEGDWKVFSRHLPSLKHAAKGAATEVEAASELLFQTVKDGYERIKRTLQ